MKYDIILAIDPDCEKSGIAALMTKNRNISVDNRSFPELLEFLQVGKSKAESMAMDMIVVVEAGWLNQTNWHTTKGHNSKYAAAIGNKTGRNHETGRKIAEMARHYGLEVVEQRPLKKCWAGPDGKITQDEISQFIPGWPKKSNSEQRDAALLAWNYAGFPIQLKPVKK